MNKTILAVDTGFGDTKVIFGDSTGVKNLYKFPSAIAQVEHNELINDSSLIHYAGAHFYVGDDALAVQNKSIVDISDYDVLEKAAPLFVLKAMKDLNIQVPDVIVLGLSIAQIANSGYYKDAIQDIFKSAGKDVHIFVLPQGASAKLAIDKYGIEFPDLAKQFNPSINYVLCDVGFNTLDICQIINGRTSSNLLRGIEKQGAVVIASNLVKSIKEKHGIDLTIPEARKVLSENQFKRRGVSYEVADLILAAKVAYADNLKVIIEDQFGDILDKVDSLFIVGGGSYFMQNLNDPFFKVPKSQGEFYNVIGYYLFGSEQVK